MLQIVLPSKIRFHLSSSSNIYCATQRKKIEQNHSNILISYYSSINYSDRQTYRKKIYVFNCSHLFGA